MSESTQIIVEHFFDSKTLEQINILRDIRLELAKAQLANIEKTVDEMLQRNIISKEEKEKYLSELKFELLKKIKELEKRKTEYNQVYADEIEFFISFVDIKKISS